MFYTFGSLPPCATIVLTRTTLVVTFANTLDFSPLCPQYLQEPPEFPSICPPSIIEFPLFNQLGLPNLTRNRSVVCISNWSPFILPSNPKSPISASLKGVIRFLVWKDSKGKTKIHSPNCPNFGSHSKRKCCCPTRLAAGTVNSTIGKLHAILNSTG